MAFGGDEIEELGGGAGVFLGFAAGVDRFEVVGGGFDGLGFGQGLAGFALDRFQPLLEGVEVMFGLAGTLALSLALALRASRSWPANRPNQRSKTSRPAARRRRGYG